MLEVLSLLVHSSFQRMIIPTFPPTHKINVYRDMATLLSVILIEQSDKLLTLEHNINKLPN